MVRRKVKDVKVDSELVYAFAKVGLYRCIAGLARLTLLLAYGWIRYFESFSFII